MLQPSKCFVTSDFSSAHLKQNVVVPSTKSERVPRLNTLGSSSTRLFSSTTPRFAAPTMSSLQRYRKDDDNIDTTLESFRSTRSFSYKPISQRSARKSAPSTYQPLSNRSTRAPSSARYNFTYKSSSRDTNTSSFATSKSSTGRFSTCSTPGRYLVNQRELKREKPVTYPIKIFNNSKMLRASDEKKNEFFFADSVLSSGEKNCRKKRQHSSNCACSSCTDTKAETFTGKKPFSVMTENDTQRLLRTMDDDDSVRTKNAQRRQQSEAFSISGFIAQQSLLGASTQPECCLQRETMSPICINNSSPPKNEGSPTVSFDFLKGHHTDEQEEQEKEEESYCNSNTSKSVYMFSEDHLPAKRAEESKDVHSRFLPLRRTTRDSVSSESSLSVFACSVSSSPSRETATSPLVWEHILNDDVCTKQNLSESSTHHPAQWSIKWIETQHPELLDMKEDDNAQFRVPKLQFRMCPTACVYIASERNEVSDRHYCKETEQRGDCSPSKSSTHSRANQTKQALCSQEKKLYFLSQSTTQVIEVAPAARALWPCVPNARVIDYRTPWLWHYIETEFSDGCSSFPCGQNSDMVECPNPLEFATTAVRRLLDFGTRTVARFAF